jgi:hypothetical protein
MREIRPSGSEGGGTEVNRSSLPLSTGSSPLVVLTLRVRVFPHGLGKSSNCRARLSMMRLLGLLVRW